MSLEKAWDWNGVRNSFWLEPAEECYFLTQRWKDKGYRTLLDLGCGLGRHAVFFARNGFEVLAMDLAPEGIDYLNEWTTRERLSVTAQVSGMNPLPYVDASIDCLFAMHVIYHTDATGMKNILQEIDRVLRPNGEFFVSLCSKDTDAFRQGQYRRVDENTVLKTEPPEVDVPHYYVDLEDIERLFSGFTVERVRHTDECLYDGQPVGISKHFFVLGKKPVTDAL